MLNNVNIHIHVFNNVHCVPRLSCFQLITQNKWKFSLIKVKQDNIRIQIIQTIYIHTSIPFIEVK